MSINRSDRTSYPSQNPQLEIVVTDDGSRTLRRIADGVTWHSESGALSESKLVFLENSGVARLLKCSERVRVFEVGFGTGLNFWVTASAALASGASLDYVSLEPDLIEKPIVDELKHNELNECQTGFDLFNQAIFENRAVDSPATCVSGDSVSLRIIHDDAATACKREAQDSFDAIYHDPFDPETAPELWTESCFEQWKTLLRPGGRLVTYCVKSKIQRMLTSAGFHVSKTRGPVGGKREVLIAEKPDSAGKINHDG